MQCTLDKGILDRTEGLLYIENGEYYEFLFISLNERRIHPSSGTIRARLSIARDTRHNLLIRGNWQT